MKNNSDGKTVACFDLLFPDLGELIGGSVREDNYQTLQEKAQKIERLVMLISGSENIRDTIAFPQIKQTLSITLPINLYQQLLHEVGKGKISKFIQEVVAEKLDQEKKELGQAYQELNLPLLTKKENIRELQGQRPALVISNDEQNKYSPLITILPLTSHVDKIYPFQVESYLQKKKGVIMVDQIRTIDRKRFGNKLGELDKEMIEKRGVIANQANLENNFYQLKPSERVIYFGIDTTAESLHIGHLFQLIQTIRFAKEDFTVLLVLGGATSKIGDPSDKLKERPQLAAEKLSQCYEKIRKQLTRLVVRPLTQEKIKEVEFAPLELFYADNPELLVNIYKILEINDKMGRNISINYLLAKGTIKQRLETGLSYLAFSNLTTGLKLISSFYPNDETSEKKNKSFAFNFPLLTDKEGKKFSKSESSKNTLLLNSNQKDFYDFFRNMPDQQAQIFIKQFTFLEQEQINELIKLNNPPKLRICQRILYELVYWLNYGEIGKYMPVQIKNINARATVGGTDNKFLTINVSNVANNIVIQNQNGNANLANVRYNNANVSANANVANLRSVIIEFDSEREAVIAQNLLSLKNVNRSNAIDAHNGFYIENFNYDHDKLPFTANDFTTHTRIQNGSQTTLRLKAGDDFTANDFKIDNVTLVNTTAPVTNDDLSAWKTRLVELETALNELSDYYKPGALLRDETNNRKLLSDIKTAAVAGTANIDRALWNLDDKNPTAGAATIKTALAGGRYLGFSLDIDQEQEVAKADGTGLGNPLNTAAVTDPSLFIGEDNNSTGYAATASDKYTKRIIDDFRHIQNFPYKAGTIELFTSERREDNLGFQPGDLVLGTHGSYRGHGVGYAPDTSQPHSLVNNGLKDETKIMVDIKEADTLNKAIDLAFFGIDYTAVNTTAITTAALKKDNQQDYLYFNERSDKNELEMLNYYYEVFDKANAGTPVKLGWDDTAANGGKAKIDAGKTAIETFLKIYTFDYSSCTKSQISELDTKKTELEAYKNPATNLKKEENITNLTQDANTKAFFKAKGDEITTEKIYNEVINLLQILVSADNDSANPKKYLSDLTKATRTADSLTKFGEEKEKFLNSAKFKGLEVGDQKDYKEIYIPLAEAAVKIRAKATKTKAEEDLITLILSRTRDFEPTKKSELEKTIKDLRSYKEGSDTDKKTAYEENIKGEYATQYDQLISKLENKLKGWSTTTKILV
ncbi:11270_t:CDS:10 [Entrophospora sp. SA101]|nr:11270_t:CDS:10 [Entrophospora sp. SA101]